MSSNPFQSQPVPSDLIASGTVTATDDTVILLCDGVSGAKAVVYGTWTGVIKFEQEIDNDIWDPVGNFSGRTGANIGSAGITANDLIVFVGIAGVRKIRARFHTATSGSATISFRASNGVSNIFADNLIAANLKAQVYGQTDEGASAGAGERPIFLSGLLATALTKRVLRLRDSDDALFTCRPGFSTVANTNVTVTTTPTQILAANALRKYAHISSPNGSINIGYGNTPTLTSSTGVVIATKGVWTITDNNLYTGAIFALTASGTAVVTVTEGT